MGIGLDHTSTIRLCISYYIFAYQDLSNSRDKKKKNRLNIMELQYVMGGDVQSSHSGLLPLKSFELKSYTLRRDISVYLAVAQCSER